MDSDESDNSSSSDSGESSSDSASEREMTNNYYTLEEDYWIKNQISEDEINYSNYIFNLEIEMSKLISNKNYSSRHEYSCTYNRINLISNKHKNIFVKCICNSLKTGRINCNILKDIIHLINGESECTYMKSESTIIKFLGTISYVINNYYDNDNIYQIIIILFEWVINLGNTDENKEPKNVIMSKFRKNTSNIFLRSIFISVLKKFPKNNQTDINKVLFLLKLIIECDANPFISIISNKYNLISHTNIMINDRKKSIINILEEYGWKNTEIYEKIVNYRTNLILSLVMNKKEMNHIYQPPRLSSLILCIF